MEKLSPSVAIGMSSCARYQIDPRSHVVKARRMKTMQRLVIHHQSVSQGLGWTGQTRTLASLHISISSSCTSLATTTYNYRYLAP
jgi:hypothetical protein